MQVLINYCNPSVQHYTTLIFFTRLFKLFYTVHHALDHLGYFLGSYKKQNDKQDNRYFQRAYFAKHFITLLLTASFCTIIISQESSFPVWASFFRSGVLGKYHSHREAARAPP